ncbi:MAG: type 1 glutamine amidotransferase [Alphaproteobacteria bacterium]|nr:type 1 glutamine amidotransferase [Alphaproteobacteria bacterium]
MKISVIETGRPPAALAEAFPDYPGMFAELLGAGLGDFEFAPIRLLDGGALPDPALLEGAVITGSPSGVYDDQPWIGPLKAFVRSAHSARLPIVGVCFGHQILADALGGDVRKSPKGWGVGRHTYEVVETRDWMVDARETFSLVASHQDQVISAPKRSVTLARSAHTDHAMLVYEDAPFMSVQGHPEFSDAFASSLYSVRRGIAYPEVAADHAIHSLSAIQGDHALVARWMARFLSMARR